MKKYLALLFLAVASLAYGQGAYSPPQVAFRIVNGYTSPIADATITVCAAGTGGIPCSPALVGAIFQDAGLTEPLSNPFTADSQGNYQFAAAPGNYTVTVTASGFAGYSSQMSLGGTGGGGGLACGTTCTANNIALFTSPSAVGNSQIFQSGSASPYDLLMGANGSTGTFVSTTQYGQYLAVPEFNDSAHVCAGSPCVSIESGASYYGTNGVSGGLVGIESLLAYSGGTTSTPFVYGSESFVNYLNGTAGTVAGNVVVADVSQGLSSGDLISNMYGEKISSTYFSSISNTSVTNNYGQYIQTGASAPGTSAVTNDYGLFIASLCGGCYANTNHSGLYIQDQGANNYANSTFFALNIQPQSIGPGFTKPTVTINNGGSYNFSGSGAPSFTCPSTAGHCVYWNTSASSAATLEYFALSNSGTWTAVNPAIGAGAANTLAGYNSSGNFSDVTIGTNLTLSGGVLNATGGGGGTPGGSSGQGQWNSGGSFAGYTMSGDCTITFSTGVILCTKTNGIAFGTGATANLSANSPITYSAGNFACALCNYSPSALAQYAPVVGLAGTQTEATISLSGAAAGQPLLYASGANPAYGALNLSNSSAITGNLGVAYLNSGTGASASTAWCGNGTWGTCGLGGSSAGAQYSSQYNSNGSGGFGAVAPPTSNGFYNLGYNVTGSASVAPTATLAGLNGRSITGSSSTDTVLYSDNLSVVNHDRGGSASVNETLPTATTLGNANFGYSYENDSSHTDTITPTTWTINGASSLSVAAGSTCRIHMNPNLSTDWLGTCPGAGAGTVSSVGVSGANGIGVSGSPITSSGTIALSLGAITPTSVNSAFLTTINTESSTGYTTVLSDDAAFIRMTSSSPNTVTIPPNSSVAYPVGASLTVRQDGSGQTTIVQGSGVTINSPSTLNLRVQGSTVQLLQISTNTWDLMGDVD